MEAQPPALCAVTSSRRARHGREQASHSTIYGSLRCKNMSTYPHSDLQIKEGQLRAGCQHKTEKDSQLLFRISGYNSFTVSETFGSMTVKL